MRRVGAAASALLVFVIVGAIAEVGTPAWAQSKSVPVKNALVILTPQDQTAFQSILKDGGSPSGIEQSLALTGGLLSQHVLQGVTFENGSFTINAPDNAGNYNISVSATGFVAAANGGSTVNIGTVGSPANLTLVLQPSAVLSGRVTDSKGNPLQGIVVSIGDLPNSANYDITTADGTFVLDTGLSTGNYTVHAFKQDQNLVKFKSLLAKLQEGLTNQPGNSQNELAQFSNFTKPSAYPTGQPTLGYQIFNENVSLQQGKLSTLNIQLNDSNVISGVVSSKSDSKPVAGIGVFAFDGSGNLVASAITNSSGRYEFDNAIGEGQYTVTVPSAVSGYFAPANLAVSIPSSAQSRADLALEPSQVITGKVIDRNGTGIANASVLAVAQNANPHGFLDHLVAGMSIAKTGPDGVFRMSNGLASGRYMVGAYFGDALPVSGNAVIDTNLASSVTIRLDYSEIVTISGTITNNNGHAVSGARILPSIATSIPGSDSFAAISRADGTFKMSVPIQDAAASSLFNQIIVTATGYATATANVTSGSSDNVKVNLSRSSNQLSGRVITQPSDSPPLESAVVRTSNLAVSDGNTTHTVAVKTNSRVIGASYDIVNKSLALNFEGMQGPGGASQIIIPKDLVTGPLAVVVDGQQLRPSNVTISQNGTYALVSFTSDHGLSHAIIEGQDSQIVPEFPYPIALTIASASLIMIIIGFTKMRKQNYNQYG